MATKLDVKKRFSEEQMIGFLREAGAGMAVKDLLPVLVQRSLVLPVARPVRWHTMSGAKRLKELEAENARLKKVLAEQILESDVIKYVLR